MIRRLVLRRYGRFHDACFDLGRVTLFLGPNESGKTTIADALLDALCQPPGNKKAGQALLSRYGEDRDVRLEPALGPEDRIDADEFRSLLCVTSGDLSIPLPAGAAWLDTLKARLFTGGIDARALVRLLERDASQQRSTNAGKRLAAAVATRDRARQELAALREARAATLGHERRLTESTARLADLGAEAEQRKAELATLSQELEQQARIARRRRCMDALRVLDELEAADREIQRTSGLGGDGAELEALEREAAARQNEAQIARQTAEVARARADQVGGALSGATAQAEAARPRAELAASLQAKLSAPESQPDARSRARVALVALGLLFAVGAAACLAFLPAPQSVAVGGSVAGVALVLLALWLRGGGGRGHDQGPWLRALETSRAEWQRVVGERLPPGNAAAEVLVRERLRYESLREEADRLAREARDLGEACEKAARDAEQAAAMDRLASAAVAGFLQARGVSSAREYIALRARHSHVLEIRRGLEESVRALMAEYGVRGPDELGRECRMRIQTLEQSITVPDMDEPTRRRKEARQRELEGQVGELAASWNNLNTELTRERGRIQGSLGNLPERIRASEQELERRSAELRDMELDRKASALAAQIMASIGVESDGLMDGLQVEMARLYGDIVGLTAGAPEGPEVRMTGLDLEGAAARDAGGMVQRYTHLSQGTRDAVALAARLALAERTGRKAGVLVLDEPFLALDNDRARAALLVLRGFLTRVGWQIILLTKEKGLAACALEVFGGELVVHDLA